MDRAGERDAGVPDPGFAGDRVLPYQPGGPLDVPLTYAGQSAAPGVLGLRPRWNDARLHDGATPGGRARARTCGSATTGRRGAQSRSQLQPGQGV